jgi:hypothetical protein
VFEEDDGVPVAIGNGYLQVGGSGRGCGLVARSAAGAFGSLELLELSGIGGLEVLKTHGIEMSLSLGGRGEHARPSDDCY